jgi:preprotein translocase subunit YajC
MSGFIFLILLFGAMWFFTIRPQQQRLKKQRELIAAVGVGDVVLTAGGLVGRIVGLDDDELMLDVGRSTPIEVRIARAAITQRLTPDDVTDAE